MSSFFWNHSKQHSSKTLYVGIDLKSLFWNHSKQHSSKTHKYTVYAFGYVLEPFETTQL